MIPYFMKDEDHLSPVQSVSADFVLPRLDERWSWNDFAAYASPEPFTCSDLTSYIMNMFSEDPCIRVRIKEVRCLELFEVRS